MAPQRTCWLTNVSGAGVDLMSNSGNSHYLGRTLRYQIQWALACRTALLADSQDAPQLDDSRPRVIGLHRWRAMVAQARHFFEWRSGMQSAHPLSNQVDSLASWDSQDLRTLLDNGSPRCVAELKYATGGRTANQR